MHTYLIAIPLPKKIVEQLKRLCFGLPNVLWTEEFHLTLLNLGQIDASLCLDVQEKLVDFHFTPFNLTLQGVNVSHSKGSRGSIWAGTEHSENLFKLKKSLNNLLKEILLSKSTTPFSPHINLGRYEKIDPRRLGEYLEIQNAFVSPAFAVDTLILLECHTTQSQTVIFTPVITNQPVANRELLKRRNPN